MEMKSTDLDSRRGCKAVGPCEAKRKGWAKRGHCDESVENMKDKPWRNEELKKLEEGG